MNGCTDVFRGLSCPHCGETDSLLLALSHPTGGFLCVHCGRTITENDICEAIPAWNAALKWVRSAPQLSDPERG